MDIFALTETEFFKKLREGLHNGETSVDVNAFFLQVHEVTNPNSPNKEYALDALVIADIEFKKIKNSQQIETINEHLVHAIEAAHQFVQYKIERHKREGITFNPAPIKDKIKKVDLHWAGDKTEFVELCYALKVGNYFGSKVTAADVVRGLSEAFNVPITVGYAKKRAYELGFRGLRKSATALLEKLAIGLRKMLNVNDPIGEAFDIEEDDNESVDAA